MRHSHERIHKRKRYYYVKPWEQENSSKIPGLPSFIVVDFALIQASITEFTVSIDPFGLKKESWAGVSVVPESIQKLI